MPGRLDFDFGFGSVSDARRRSDSPMRILVLGDYSGSGACESPSEKAPLADRATRRVDIDHFDDLMRDIAPRVELPAEGDVPAMQIDFTSLDDFHPDALYERLEVFQALRKTRERLADPATYAEAAAGLKRWAQSAPANEEAPAEPGAAESDEDLFSRLLGERPAARSQPTLGGQRVDISGFIRSVVAPHIVPGTDPQQPMLIASVDDAISERMRAVLHHARFQQVESAWRSLYGLVNTVETDEGLTIHVLDVDRGELAADLSADDLRQSALYKLLVERGAGTAGGQPWSFVVADFTFSPEPQALMLLAGLATVAAQAGGPLLAGATAEIVGCRSLADTPDPHDWSPVAPEAQAVWRALRVSPMAPWIGLALPRLLLRLPYGPKSDPVDAFDFTEIPGGSVHGPLLWGNAAFGCAMLLADSYAGSGWSMSPGDSLQLEDLPTYVFDSGGERVLQPVAEVLLSDRAGDAILAQGLMPLLSVRGRNAARVMRFQSVADPPAALRGPWR